ncbi:MAG: hypothetical protein FJ335_05225 [Sphingomonadales bacterium]|nr:hypothetical protein [Sphingomonadales bacterium]
MNTSEAIKTLKVASIANFVSMTPAFDADYSLVGFEISLDTAALAEQVTDHQSLFVDEVADSIVAFAVEIGRPLADDARIVLGAPAGMYRFRGTQVLRPEDAIGLSAIVAQWSMERFEDMHYAFLTREWTEDMLNPMGV